MSSQEGNKIKNQKRTTGNGPGKVEKSLQSVLGGTFLTREKALKMLPYLFFLAMLAIIYIANIYVAERKTRQIKDINTDLKELRYEYISTKSELMFLSKQSQVAKRLENTGIRESRVPPEKIIVKKEDE